MLVGAKSEANRADFALLLLFYRAHGRFPDEPNLHGRRLLALYGKHTNRRTDSHRFPEPACKQQRREYSVRCGREPLYHRTSGIRSQYQFLQTLWNATEFGALETAEDNETQSDPESSV
jgi:hypothetical protein